MIFDVGNVLYGWNPDRLLSKQIPDDAARRKFVEDIDLFAWHETLDGGRSFDEAGGQLSAMFPDYAQSIAAWGERFGETIEGPVPGTHDIVRELHRNSIPLFAITNFSADFWKPFYETERSFLSLFKQIVVSGEVRMLKPDPRIYQFAIQHFGIQPQEAIFIDDRAINVLGAVDAGMRGHVFTDAPDLRKKLQSEGLL